MVIGGGLIRRRARLAMAGWAVALGVGGLACRPPAPPPDAPRLLLVIVIDQFPSDYLDRFAPLYTGGLRRLLNEGVLFTDAHHRHAVTHTAPGHASLATGVHPRRHGVISNYWSDRREGRRIYSAEDPDHGVSPVNLLVPALGDWLKQRSSRSRVYAVSGKDRSAALLAGHRADAAFWYDEGEWDSSTYYRAGAPDWLEEFNDRRLLDVHFGTAWEPLPVPPEVLADVGVVPFDLGPLEPDFPHVFGGFYAADERFYDGLSYSPWLDAYMTRFVEELIAREDLGGDGWTDVLALAYSALDAVGHRFGGDSREALDVVLRLDLELGALLDFVDRRIGLEHVVVAVSSDHGVAPMPELGRGRRLDDDDFLCFQRINDRLSERFGEDVWLSRGPFLEPAALERHGVERAVVEREVARLMLECPAVTRVFTRSQLLAEPAAAGAELFYNAFHPQRSPDFLLELEPYLTATVSSAATHGGSHRYDTHVPLAFLVPGVGPLRDGEPAATVDLAPTLAALAGLEVPAGLDGVDLGPRMRRPAAGVEAPSTP